MCGGEEGRSIVSRPSRADFGVNTWIDRASSVRHATVTVRCELAKKRASATLAFQPAHGLLPGVLACRDRSGGQP